MSKYRKRKAVYDVPSTPFETWVANIWLIAVIVFVPLVFHNYYYDILPSPFVFLTSAGLSINKVPETAITCPT